MTIDATALLDDYEQNIAMIAACRKQFRSLIRQKRLLVEALDAATRPAAKEREARAIDRAQSITPPACGYQYRGTVITTQFAVDAYCGVIGRVWKDFPDSRLALRAVLNASAGIRRGVAATPDELFPARTAHWRRGKYRKLSEGVFIDINLSNSEKLRRLRAVARASRLDWGREVEVYGF